MSEFDVGNFGVFVAPSATPPPPPLAPAPVVADAPSVRRSAPEQPPASAAAAAADYGKHPWEAETVLIEASTHDRNAAAEHQETINLKSERWSAQDNPNNNSEMRQAAAAAAARQNLSPEQQVLYDKVSTAAEANSVPDALHALETLARNGTLAQNPGILTALAQIATDPIAPMLLQAEPDAANRLVGETLRQIENPNTIHQDPKFDTCGEAVTEQQLAGQDPGRYCQFLADMASNGRDAHLPNGAKIDLPNYQLNTINESGRSMASTLYQQGLHAAYGEKNAEDGVSAKRLDQMIQAQFPGKELLTIAPQDRLAAVALLQPGTTAILDVPGAKDDEKHAVNVLSVDNAADKVYFVDPNGAEAVVSIKVFAEYMAGAVLPKGSGISSTNENFDIGTGSGAYTQASASTRRRRP
jgi:hypothetical protein